MKSIFRFALFLLILLVGTAILAFYWTFYKSLPDYSATVELAGIESPVDIHWDPFGVPHIYANNEMDLYYAVGYVHAQDRLWQMTLSQIAAEGRFAEFFGKDLLDFDKYQRTLGFWNTAKRIEESAPEEIQQILDAYSKGINDFVAKNRRHLPIQFSLANLDPIPWTPAHSYAITRLMAWELNVGWWNELTYASLAEQLSSSVMQELYPVYDDNDPTMMDDELSSRVSESLLPLIDMEFKLREYFQKQGTSVGSNAWAVNGSRTETGLPLLAGDPHMGLSIPGNWYEANLSFNGRNVSGATLPGLPFVVLGQNDELAWSLTNMMADDIDFFLELSNPEDTNRYVVDSLNTEVIYETYEWRDEVLRIRNEDDQLYRVKTTKHGPVISNIHPNQEIIEDRVVTMSWAGHEVSHELWSLYKINRAGNFDDFQDAVEEFKSPGLNFTYADRSGNIAILSAAGLPIRDHNPILFRKGWDPSYDWQDWIPFDELPKIINPPSGFVANANNKLHTESYPHYISTFWEPPSRIERIEEYFSNFDTLTVEIFQQMQNDSYSVHAREVVEQILPVLRFADEEYDFSLIAPYLENWNFRYDLESTAATILDAFFLAFTRNTLLDELGEVNFENFIRLDSLPVRVMNRLLQNDSFLFNNIHTEITESRDDIIIHSMQDAINWLSERYSEEPIQWRWENTHTITFRPPFFAEASNREDASSALRLIVKNLMSKGPYPVPGHGMSLINGQYSWLDPFEMDLGPSIRRIVDLSSLSRSHSVLPTGQSGNPLSDFFGDQTDLWLNGQYRYIYQDSTFFREIGYQSMRLVPASQ